MLTFRICISFGGFLGFLVTMDGKGDVDPALDFSDADLGLLCDPSGERVRPGTKK